LTIRIVEQYAVAIMNIQLNGETFNASGPLSISRLLVRLGIDCRRVAVEHNCTVVKKSAYTSTLISDGDAIEVVNFVGGG